MTNCQVPENQQLSPLEVGEDNLKLKHKSLEKFKSITLLHNNRGFRHVESKSGLSFGLALLLNLVLAPFSPNSVFASFPQKLGFCVKLDSQSFQNISPWHTLLYLTGCKVLLPTYSGSFSNRLVDLRTIYFKFVRLYVSFVTEPRFGTD